MTAGGEGMVPRAAHNRVIRVRFPAPLPIVLALALLAGGGAWAGTEQTPPSFIHGVVSSACPADADMRGLLAALDDTASRLTGLDALAVADGAAEIRTRIRARAALCERLDAAADELAAVREQVTLRDRLLEIERGNVATYRAEWETLLAKPKTGGRGPLGFSLGAGLCASSADDVRLCGAAVWGFRW